MAELELPFIRAIAPHDETFRKKLYFDSMRPSLFKTVLAKCAVSGQQDAPTDFTVTHVFGNLPNNSYPILLEASIWEDSSGDMHAVFRQGDAWKIWKARSPSGANSGVSWTDFALLIDPVGDPCHFGGSVVHNPGIVYDSSSGTVRGIMYGCSPNGTSQLGEAKINVSYPQYKIFAHTGSVVHGNGHAIDEDSFMLGMGSYTTFDRIQVCDPVSQTVLLDQQGMSGAAGDIYSFTP